MKPKTIKQQIVENEKLFKKAVEKAELNLRKGDLNAVIGWAKVASHFAFVRHPGFYISPTLENLLLELAQRIEKQPPDVSATFHLKTKNKNYGKMRFLHIITESYVTGGHSPFIARWIKNTLDNSVHSLIATANNVQLPNILTSSIMLSGGWYCSLSELSPNLLNQALLLRLIAKSWADVIVLFVHPYDPLPTVAFGVEGGPPIIFCNHADHAFWLGGSVADIIVDYHSSGGELSAKRRGTSDSKILPIPLTKTSFTLPNLAVRKELGLSDNEIMLLTVGRDEKFLPFGCYDFLDLMVKILKRHPNSKLFAVGPKNEGRWEKASVLVDGRIKAMGTVDRSILKKYYEAADLYVASFPCGSETALLEAGVHGLPMVGLHLKELPHISGWDDVAFKKLNVHTSSISSFMLLLDYMIKHKDYCRRRALLVKKNIEQEHCFPGWNTYLDDVMQSLPSQHHIRKPRPIGASLDNTDAYMAYIDSEMLFNESLEHSFGRLVRVYSTHLPKTDVLKAQAECFIGALLKVNSVKRAKEYLYHLREFLEFTLK